jgi:O-antigen/teichoic acid export membrane protein
MRASALVSARGPLWTAGGIIASAVAAFGASMLLVARTSPAVFADIAIFTITLLTLSNILRFGADRIFIGEVNAASKVGGEPAGVRRGASLIAFGLVAGGVGAVAIFLSPLRYIFDFALTTPLTGWERLFGAVWLASDVVRMVTSEGHRSGYRFKSAAMAGVGVRAPLYLAILVGLAAVEGTLGRTMILGASALGSVAVALISLLTVSPRFPWWSGKPVQSGLHLWRGHVSMLLTTVAATLIGGADIWIVGATTGDATAAPYAFAVTVVAGIGMLTSAVASGLSPYIAKCLRDDGPPAMQRMLRPYVQRSSLLAALAYGLLLLVAEPIAVALGGDSYHGVLPLVAILGAGQLVGVLAGPGGGVLAVARLYRALCAITCSVAVTAVGLELLAGALTKNVMIVAIASSAATAALHVGANFALARKLDVTTHVFSQSVPT